MIYDIFYVSKEKINEIEWQKFRSRFPSAQKIENVETIDDIKKKAFTKFFWLVWDDIIVADNFTFDYRVEKWDESYIHSFLNSEFRDGICLFPKSATITQKEFNHRFYFNKKEIDIIASIPKPYDIVFISYNELNAEENYQRLIDRFPRAKRINGVTGIHNAHLAAAKLATTEMFWVVDADAILVDDFNFDIEYFPHYDAGNRAEHHSTVYVWSSKNPINDLVYGYGGVKLLPTKLVLEMNTDSVDMTTSISDKFKVMNKVSNITAFNTDEFNTWKSAFRECVKLTSKVIDKNYQVETEERLRRWCRTGIDREFGNYAIGGAIFGYRYGMKYISNKEKLAKINDFEWIWDIYLKWKKHYEI